MYKELRKSRNRKVAGVCGGIAEYLDLDPTVIRIAFCLLTLFSAAFPGLIIYFILALIMPD